MALWGGMARGPILDGMEECHSPASGIDCGGGARPMRF